ncbi:hypothetical protein [Actinacidiphila sp. ITFR-21]|uniref:hypothetical protein n=1 Tax=Actinacidiphila sp. ITFR-21 TaxID=3075199 RepID=UPI00288B213E|nr:hypothetical protein [Streptomyces sp. ITFR-21]WNI19181.1 hypothetical protein RLT57_29000 [Streptomyces sp. ITFR-21]
MAEQTPSVGRIVHYVSTATGEAVCRAAIVTEVGAERIGVHVFLPDVTFSDRAAHSETSYDGGTWHWPERVG